MDLYFATQSNNACTRLVGLLLRSVRVFEQFPWLEAGSVKVALSRPAHQRVTRAVGRQLLHYSGEYVHTITMETGKYSRK